VNPERCLPTMRVGLEADFAPGPATLRTWFNNNLREIILCSHACQTYNKPAAKNSSNTWKVGALLVSTTNPPASCAKPQSKPLKLKVANKVIEVESSLNPAIFKSPTTGKTFIVAGDQPWIEIPPETTLDDVKWIPAFKPVKTATGGREQVFEVEGSRNSKYTVKQAANGSWNCTCVGFGFRNKCKHVTNCKLIINSIEDN